MLEYHFIISGRVQGVGFRYFVESKAISLGINGWVKNTMDGKVECIAQHDDKKVLDEFEDHLRIGPPMSRVEKIRKDIDENPKKQYTDFLIV